MKRLFYCFLMAALMMLAAASCDEKNPIHNNGNGQEELVLPEYVLLSHDLLHGAGAHPAGQRSLLGQHVLPCVLEEIHAPPYASSPNNLIARLGRVCGKGQSDPQYL